MKLLAVPEVIEKALTMGAQVVISVSGGKDSQALANVLVANGIGSYALHMDLGRAEWPQTAAHVEKIAQDNRLDLTVVNRPQGDLLDQIEARAIKLQGTGKPFWPSAASRYCTADQKRGQADKVLRRHQLVISAEGIRADESAKRAKDPVVSIRKQITAKHLRTLNPSEALSVWEKGSGRLALTWNAIHDWSIDNVWAACGADAGDLEKRRIQYKTGDEIAALDGWPCHPAYVFGNTRLSCVFCVLACEGDLVNGAQHNPGLVRQYVDLETRYGSTFRHGRALSDIVKGAL